MSAKGPVLCEGFMEKSASSKKDEIKDNWKKRWFVLRGDTLYYYKKKDDSEAKGTMDLDGAKIDPADSKTGKIHTLRLKQGQPKEIFTYFICPTQAEQHNWLKVLRKAAGYDMEGEEKKFVNQQSAVCSYGILLLIKDQPERIVMHVEMTHQYLQFWLDDKLHEEHPGVNVVSTVVAKTPDLSLQQADGVVDLFSVKIEIKTADRVSKAIKNIERKLYCGTLAEAKEIEKLLYQLSMGDFSTVRTLITKYPIVARTKLKLGDMEEGHNWAPRFAALAEKRCLFFRKEDAKVPVWSVLIHTSKLEEFDRTTIKVESGLETCLLKFDSAETCSNWLTLFKETKQKFNIMTVVVTEKRPDQKKKK